MAMAKPTVVSQNGGLPDAAVDGWTGFIVPPGDTDKLSSAILRLLRDQELASRLGRNARQRVEELFDVEKNTRKL
jgi:glycosyltransferase involved in cell wall biosynthesis